jgi:hypothetical protein
MLLCTTQLAGCWFVFIPGSMVGAITDSIGGYEGQHCVSATAKVGDRIKHTNGSIGTVMKLEGESSRCQNPQHPIRAVVRMDDTSTPDYSGGGQLSGQ